MVKKIEPKRSGILESIEDRLSKSETDTSEMFSELLQRLDTLESHAEKNDASIKLMEQQMQNRDKIIEMLREHTLRLVKEKEQLLLNLGFKRMNELKDDKDVIT